MLLVCVLRFCDCYRKYFFSGSVYVKRISAMLGSFLPQTPSSTFKRLCLAFGTNPQFIVPTVSRKGAIL